MDTAQWAQGIGVVKPMESGSKVPSSSSSMLERRARPVKDQALNCPRCNSTNTKFCYYNNYSLSQPRYFCKTCRRYWTEGGSLRNVPVGGGSRKNKRSTPSSSPSTTTSSKSTLPSSKKLLPDLTTPPPQQSTTCFPHHQSASQNPKIHQGQDLNLAYPPPPNNSHDDYNNNNSNNISSSNSAAMELLKNGIASAASRGLNSFMPMSLSDSNNTMYSSAGLIPMQEFKPAGINFSLEGFENGYGGGIQGIHHHHHQVEGSAGARVLFPVEDLKQHQVQSNHHAEFVEQNRSHQGDSTGYWNGMLGGGSW